MGKRPGSLDVACATAFVDVDQHRASKGVLCSIENTIYSPKHAVVDIKTPVAKKQRCLELDQRVQGVKRLDASSLFAQARSVLRQPPTSAVQAPIGREQQSQALDVAVQEFVNTGAGKSLYVSGLPGTGKSHTVRKVLQQLLCRDPQAPVVTWINCMSITSAGQIYSQVASSATGCSKFQLQGDQAALQGHPSDMDSTCHAELDLDLSAATHNTSNAGNTSASYKQLLDKLSRPQANCSHTPQTSSRPTRKYKAARSCISSRVSMEVDLPADSSPAPAAAAARTPTRSLKDNRSSSNSSTKHIIVLDEIDNLLKKSQADLVQLFLLPHEPAVQVLVIGVANSIDLTERMLPELKLKMCSPQLICFPAYTTKQLTDILTTCLDKLPCMLFEPSAVDLCSRSVGTSSGDLRHALRACRAAVDELERQQLDISCTAPSTPPRVTVRFMMGALARLASVRSSQFGAQATSSIRTLPNQQQLLLYALSVLCRPSSAAGDDTQYNDSKKGASSLWAAAGTASTLTSSGGGSKPGKRHSAAAGGSQQVFVLAVGMEEAFAQYKQVCRLLSLPPCSRAEVQHMAELLAQMALVDVVHPAASTTAASASRAMGASGLGGIKGWGARSKGFGGLGGSKSVGKGSGPACGQQHVVKLCLKASVEEVEAAVKHNPALRCLVDK